MKVVSMVRYDGGQYASRWVDPEYQSDCFFVPFDYEMSAVAEETCDKGHFSALPTLDDMTQES